jgi:hypothetical protein
MAGDDRPKLSAAMERVLFNLLNGNRVNHHCRTMSDYGGLDGTVRALVRRGLITAGCELTPKGREAAKAISDR